VQCDAGPHPFWDVVEHPRWTFISVPLSATCGSALAAAFFLSLKNYRRIKTFGHCSLH
jgi:hypothetical protein